MPEYLTALATIAVALFTAMLWRSTHLLWKTSIKQSEDTQRAIRATEAISEKMEMNARRHGRAYVSVLNGQLWNQDNKAGKTFSAQIVVRNTGYTPAHAVNAKVCLAFLDHPLPGTFDLTQAVESYQAAGHISPHNQYQITAFLGRMLSDLEISETKTSIGRKLYIYGTVIYRDIFNQDHTTNFCQWIVWDGNAYSSTLNINRHNDAT